MDSSNQPMKLSGYLEATIVPVVTIAPAATINSVSTANESCDMEGTKKCMTRTRATAMPTNTAQRDQARYDAGTYFILVYLQLYRSLTVAGSQH